MKNERRQELMERYRAEVRGEVEYEKKSRDSASYCVNTDMIRETNQVSRGNERLFRVEKGRLVPRDDKFQ